MIFDLLFPSNLVDNLIIRLMNLCDFNDFHICLVLSSWCSTSNSCSCLVQLRAKQTAPLVNKHYQNDVTLTGQSPPLTCCQPLEILTLYNGLRSLNDRNMGSVGQRAGHQTLRMFQIWYNSNQGRSVRPGPGPCSRLFHEISKFES